MRIGAVTAAVLVTALAAGCTSGPGSPQPSAAGHVMPSDNARPSTGGPSSPIPLRAGERFVQLELAQPYTPSPPAGGTDEYRCFLLDPKLTQPAFLTGSQFLPQNVDIVHHATFYRVDPADVAQARQLDADAPGDGWTCFGGTGIGDPRQTGAAAAWIASWAPGVRERLLAARTGYRLETGTQVVMEIHYNLLATGGAPGGSDRSGIRLRLAGGDADLDPLQVSLLVAPIELPCAPGESGPLCDRAAAIADAVNRFGEQAALKVRGLTFLCNGGRTPPAGPTQRCDHTAPEAGIVHAVGGHMHLLGRSITVELNPERAGARKLFDVPIYNFDDQSFLELSPPVTVAKGDTLRVTCTHDATLRARLPQLRGVPPRYVVWGDGTSDEMCLGIVIWSRPR